MAFTRRTTWAIIITLVLAPLIGFGQDAYLTNAHVPFFVKANTGRTISVRVRNSASTPLITFRVDWRWNNDAVQTGYTQTTTGISGNQYWPYEHPIPFAIAQGQGTLKVWVVGNGETNPANDTLAFKVTALDQWAAKTMLLDLRTATWCAPAPPALAMGNALDADPQVVVARHHDGDQFSTGSSTAYLEHHNVDFTPAGIIDQGEYGTYEPNPAYDQWADQMNKRKEGVSPVELSMATEYDALSRLLTVHLNATYTFGLQGSHTLNAFVVEDGISAPQANAPVGYIHAQVVRDVLGGAMGNGGVIPDQPVPGTTYSTTYGLILPEDWEARNIRVIGFVTHAINGEAYTLNARSSTALVVGLDETNAAYLPMKVHPNPAKDALWIDLPNAHGPAMVTVLSLDGRMVLEEQVTFGGIPLALEGFGALSSGVYVLRVLDGDVQQQVRMVKE
jgi:hypothetical protein